MISLKVRCTLRVSASSSALASTSSGSASIRADQVRLLGDELAEPHPLGRLDEDPDRPVGDLEHPGDDAGDADPLELIGTGLLELGVSGGDHHQRPLAARARR